MVVEVRNYSDITHNLLEVRSVSPARCYPSSPPAFSNLELLGRVWREKTEKVLLRHQAELPAKTILSAEKCVLFGNGHVILQDGSLVAETIAGSSVTSAPDFDAAGLEVMRGDYALLRKAGDSNFGHWLVELLPRIIDFQEALDGNIKFLVPLNPMSMLDLRRRSMELMGVDEERIVPVSAAPRMVERLHFITSNSIHSHTHDAERLTEMVETIKSRKSATRLGRRIFAGRESALRRKLLNEDSILHVAEKHGFEIVYPERLTLDEQIDVFSQSSMIAGVSGAALTNVIWAAPKTPVLSMLPNVGHEFFFWDLANIFGLKFSFIFGDARNPEMGGHSDFEVDSDLFTAWIKRYESL